MGYHSNDKQEKCWSCEFFCGERKRKTSFLLGDSTDTSSNGTCSCKRSSHFNKSVSESSWCSKYQKWGVIASALAKKENDEIARKQKLENQKLEREMQEERERTERERRELERERYALEQERKKLEYERWYSSLSPEDKIKEDQRIEEEKRLATIEAEERRIRYEKEAKEREAQRLIDEENARKRKKKNLIVIFSLIGAIILLIVGINVGKSIANSIEEKRQIEAFNNSSTGLFTKYLSEQDGYTNGMYASYIDVEERGRIYFSIEYKKNGFIDNYRRTCDFRVVTFLLPKTENSFTEIEGYFFFNLDGSDNDDSFGITTSKYGFTKEGYPNYCAKAKYGNGEVLVQYQQVSFNTSSQEPEYGGAYFHYTNWDKQYNDCQDEWVDSGWIACYTSYLFANELFKEATGSTLYK